MWYISSIYPIYTLVLRSKLSHIKCSQHVPECVNCRTVVVSNGFLLQLQIFCFQVNAKSSVEHYETI